MPRIDYVEVLIRQKHFQSIRLAAVAAAAGSALAVMRQKRAGGSICSGRLALSLT